MKINNYASLTNVMDLLVDAICVVDRQGHFISVSAACERIFGYTPEEMIGMQMIDLVFHEDQARTLHAVEKILAGQLQPHFENRYVRKDGRVVHIMWSARWSEADQVRVAVARDITERKRADSMQAALYAISEAAHAAEDLPTLFDQIHQIIGSLLQATNFCVALYDRTRDEVTFPHHVDEFDSAPVPHKLDSASLSAEVICSGKALLLTPDTKDFPPQCVLPDVDRACLNWLGVPLNAKKGVIGAIVVRSYSPEVRYTEKDLELLQFVSAQIANAIERKQAEIRLQHVAVHDSLTDLPNRTLFHDRLQSALLWARRNQAQLSLLYLDLDKFKEVNDTLGHAVGDLLLQETARRLKLCVRESDTVGRIGGDEFLVLLNNIHLPEDTLLVAEKIRIALGQPFDLAGQCMRISPSIGVALYPEHSDDYKQLIRYADQAMYDAKKRGGNQVRVTPGPAPLDDLKK